ncbi:unnamed protein product [Ectocarpus sp. 4 AP-2014]
MRGGQAEQSAKDEGESERGLGGGGGESQCSERNSNYLPLSLFFFLWYRVKNQARNDDTEKGRRQSSGPVRKKSRPGISNKNAKMLKEASLESRVNCASSLFSSRNWQGLTKNVGERRKRSNQRQNKRRRETLDNIHSVTQSHGGQIE